MSTEEYPQDVEQQHDDAPQEDVDEEAAAAEEDHNAAEEAPAAHPELENGHDESAKNEELAAAEADAADNDGEYMDGDLTDRRVLIAEMHRVDGSASAICGALTGMITIDDEELRANLADVVADIQAEEDHMFSPMPDYIAKIVDADAERRRVRNQGVQPHDDIGKVDGPSPAGNYDQEHRAFVDPSVPLTLPYSLERQQRENPNPNSATGVYHDLFYGDGTQCVFSPPEDSTRFQIEDRQRASKTLQRPPVSYEPPPRQSLKVSKDFVPSCAAGTSASQRDTANPTITRGSYGAPPAPKKKKASPTKAKAGQ